MSTKALYLDDTYLFQSSAQVEAIERNEHGLAVILDQTIFYPQGGGQPTDIGTIVTVSAEFQVIKVLYCLDGTIAHYGLFLKGELKVGDKVTLLINDDRRIINARNHTAGHMLAFAAEKFYPQLVGIKGYHFPDGPYVEFDGSLNEMEKIQASAVLQRAVRQMIEQKLPIAIRLVTVDELAKICRNILLNIPKDKPTRVMIIDGFGLGCGGTHVANTKEIDSFVVRKVKQEKGKVKISYTIA